MKTLLTKWRQLPDDARFMGGMIAITVLLAIFVGILLTIDYNMLQ